MIDKWAPQESSQRLTRRYDCRWLQHERFFHEGPMRRFVITCCCAAAVVGCAKTETKAPAASQIL